MSAYGKISAPAREGAALLPRVYSLAREGVCLAVFHLSKSQVPLELAEYLRQLFNAVVQEGRTYPQENELDEQAFSDYMLSYDLFLGLLMPSSVKPKSGEALVMPELTVEGVRDGRKWSDCVAGIYYVKPNYPGRSSHICNGGFVVAPTMRGLKAGLALGRSYLYNAPRLGYRASVFNLVYVSNVASLRIWDQLGFSRAGLIPAAGRLKAAEEVGTELYVDAVVYYKRFDAV